MQARQTETAPPVQARTSGQTIMNTKVLVIGTGAFYRVQLTANRNPIDAVDYYRTAGVDREVLVEQHEGYYKYTVGPFSTYEQAISYKQQVERLPDITDAFVVSYRNGRRVSMSSGR